MPRALTNTRWTFYSLLLALGLALGVCASASSPRTSDIQHILAPTGALRVALYTGTPTSLVSESDHRGVGYDLGQALARRLGVPFRPLVFANNADVQEAIKAGQADVAFTNASAERAKVMDFTEPYLLIELGYLSRDKGPVTSLADVDRPGVRVGVTANSSSDAVLSHSLKNARVVRTQTIAAGIQMLAAGTIDVYATNKAILFEMADSLPGSRVLDGNWGFEKHALGIPKGRDAGLPFVRAFVANVIARGTVKTAVARAGLRGAQVASTYRER